MSVGKRRCWRCCRRALFVVDSSRRCFFFFLKLNSTCAVGRIAAVCLHAWLSCRWFCRRPCGSHRCCSMLRAAAGSCGGARLRAHLRIASLLQQASFCGGLLRERKCARVRCCCVGSSKQRLRLRVALHVIVFRIVNRVLLLPRCFRGALERRRRRAAPVGGVGAAATDHRCSNSSSCGRCGSAESLLSSLLLMMALTVLYWTHFALQNGIAHCIVLLFPLFSLRSESNQALQP